MFINAVFDKDKSKFCPERCKIEDVLYLEEEKYSKFKEDVLADLHEIFKNKDKLYRDEEGVLHVLLVTSKGNKDGIIVDASSKDVARYCSFVPNINDYIQLKLKEIVDNIVEEGTVETASGTYIFTFRELEEEYGVDVGCLKSDFFDEVTKREEVSEVDITDEDIQVYFYLDYCPNVEPDENCKAKTKHIEVLIVEPNKNPKQAIIENEYEMFRSIVGGHVERVSLTDGVELLFNDEAKEMGLAENRKNGKEMIAGTFIIAGVNRKDNNISLTDSQIEEYKKRFWNPEEHSEEELEDAESINNYSM